ncbi:hypothetical protein XENTR_v10000926 [Xenopus tropicalis]|nr:hypothetical protein XENTR_v10000926 [Xenopus tropicalis]
MAEGDIQIALDEDQEQALEEQLTLDLQRMLGDSVNDPCFQDDPEWSEEELALRQNTPPDERRGNTLWCKCGNCIPMPTREESCCCSENQKIAHYFDGDTVCITSVPEMLTMCTEENHLDFMIRWSGRYSRAAYMHDRNRVLRKAAYRAFTTWAHCYLGPGNRIPIPSLYYPAIDMAFDF